MINLLEQTSLNETEVEQQLKSLMSIPGTHLHWYGKKERREGRKSGHITITQEKIETALSTADNVRKILKN
jgi:5-(carboxyamino)imidazole ribonucleotide synthase